MTQIDAKALDIVYVIILMEEKEAYETLERAKELYSKIKLLLSADKIVS